MKKTDRASRTTQPADPNAMQDAMPESDPAFAILAGILNLVPASRWTFARVEPNGHLKSLFGSHSLGRGLAGLTDEFGRQRAVVAAGPRIASSLGPLDGFASGITLLFADSRTDFGILTLFRTLEAGPFKSAEIGFLTFGLEAASDRLADLRLQPPSRDLDTYATKSDGVLPRAKSHPEAFYVLGADLRIVLGWPAADDDGSGASTSEPERLPAVLEQAVRELTADWGEPSKRAPGVSHPVPFLVVRTQPLSGSMGHFIGVHIARFFVPNSLTGPASRFHISPREVQVLARLLEGHHLEQIATHLHITSSTVQDHIKSMLDKTESGNRSELIARVLGWESIPNARHA